MVVEEYYFKRGSKNLTPQIFEALVLCMLFLSKVTKIKNQALSFHK
jgi:hypothetical protein